MPDFYTKLNEYYLFEDPGTLMQLVILKSICESDDNSFCVKRNYGYLLVFNR